MDEEKNKKRKPYRNYLWFVLIVILILAVIIIRTLLQDDNKFFVGKEKTMFVILSFIFGVLLYVIVYQIGKMIFALLSGFKIISANILMLNFVKKENKLKVEFIFPEGWGGLIHVIPNKEYDRCKPILFHLGGFIFTIIFAVLSSLIAYFVDPTKKIVYILLILSIMGIIVLIVNMIPVYTDGVNDGFAIRLLLEKKNKKAYLDNLYQYEALYIGNRELQDFSYEDYDDTFQAYSLIYRYYYFMNKEDFTSAKKVCDLILEHREFISSEDVELAESNKLYFILLSESDEKCYDYYYSLDKGYRNFVISTSNYETLKTGLLVASKIEKTYDLYEHLLKSENKTKELYYKTRVVHEEKLVLKAKEDVLKSFPDWKD